MNGREQGFGLPLFSGILLIILLLAAAALYVLNQQRSNAEFASAEVLLFSNQTFDLASTAHAAFSGEKSAFTKLHQFKRVAASAERVEQTAATTAVVEPGDVRRAWLQFLVGLDQLLQDEDALMAGADASQRASTLVAELRSRLDALRASMSPPQQQESALTLEQVEARIRTVDGLLEQLAAGSAGGEVASEITAALQSVQQTLSALAGQNPVAGVPVISGGEVQTNLESIAISVDQLRTEMRAGLEVAGQRTDGRRAVLQMEGANRGLFAATAGARNKVDNKERELWQTWWIPLVLLGGALLSALGFVLSARTSATGPATAAAEAAVEQTDKHQEAILRLLDEMGNLADGDLTVEATVTEDITGAIADSINYAIEALRELVSTIDGAAESVDSAARQTQAAANHLAKASENQSRQVASATTSITNMATSIEQVSNNAERSSDVARHSVEIAHKGGEAVRRTIDGMNTIRETIQDTSKRIKRLGESSQEIGNIVELINDIAEQTNILALNASIQASMAGEAGRGFAVVADEVQRLAERSTSATKQIEVLVKTIQSDTNEAVVSMERSTTDVVSGALLAENAGAALDEIEKVSNQIASLVQNISGMGRQQATAAADVTRNMGVLQEISAQTAENTSATSHSIGKLAEMASRMRRSVAGFTLPREEESPKTELDDEMRNQLAAEKNEFIDTLIVSERNPT